MSASAFGIGLTIQAQLAPTSSHPLIEVVEVKLESGVAIGRDYNKPAVVVTPPEFGRDPKVAVGADREVANLRHHALPLERRGDWPARRATGLPGDHRARPQRRGRSRL